MTEERDGLQVTIQQMQRANDVLDELLGNDAREIDTLSDALQTAEASLRSLQAQMQQLVTLARHAANGWACFATRKKEHDEIARIHQAITDLAGLIEGEPSNKS